MRYGVTWRFFHLISLLHRAFAQAAGKHMQCGTLTAACAKHLGLKTQSPTSPPSHSHALHPSNHLTHFLELCFGMRTPNEHCMRSDGHELGLLCLRALSVSASKYRQVASSHRGAVLRAVLIPGVVHCATHWKTDVGFDIGMGVGAGVSLHSPRACKAICPSSCCACGHVPKCINDRRYQRYLRTADTGTATHLPRRSSPPCTLGRCEIWLSRAASALPISPSHAAYTCLSRGTDTRGTGPLCAASCVVACVVVRTSAGGSAAGPQHDVSVGEQHVRLPRD